MAAHERTQQQPGCIGPTAVAVSLLSYFSFRNYLFLYCLLHHCLFICNGFYPNEIARIGQNLTHFPPETSSSPGRKSPDGRGLPEDQFRVEQHMLYLGFRIFSQSSSQARKPSWNLGWFTVVMDGVVR